MDFADQAQDVATECFDALGDCAVFVTGEGIRKKCKAIIRRANETEGHVGQASLVGCVPVCIGEPKRGDELRCEGRRFTVVKELDRDQHEIRLQLKDSGPL